MDIRPRWGDSSYNMLLLPKCSQQLKKKWILRGLDDSFLKQFWKQLWLRKQPRKLTVFTWQIIHYALAVGEWNAKCGYNASCYACGYPLESQAHCLWTCPKASQIWARVLRLMAYIDDKITFSWGMVMWGSCSAQVQFYEKDIAELGWALHEGRLCQILADKWTTNSLNKYM